MCWGKPLCINLSEHLQFKVNIITDYCNMKKAMGP